MEHSSLTLNRARDARMVCDSEVKSWIKTEKLQLAEEADFIYTEDEGIHNWDFWNKHLEEAFIFLND